MIFKGGTSYAQIAMSASLWSMWNTAAQLGLTKPSAAEMALLLLLGASLLALRACRETYFKIWIAGWIAFTASQYLEHFASRFPAPFGLLAQQATFVLGAGLLAGAVLVYTRSRNLTVPLAVITVVLVGFSGVRVLLSPDSLPLRVALEVSYRIVLLTASITLLYARRGRWNPSAWLVAICLPLLHLSWPPFTELIPRSIFLAGEIGLGLGMLDRKSTRLNSSHVLRSRMPSSA